MEEKMEEKDKRKIKIRLFIAIITFIALTCAALIPKLLIKRNKCCKKQEVSGYSIPVNSPYVNNVGICYSVEMADWFVSDSVKYSSQLQNLYSYKRLQKVSNKFKLIRIYQYLIAGFESTGNICPEGYALTKLAIQDRSIEAVIGTSNNLSWYDSQANTDIYIRILKKSFGRSIGQVKTLLIGNEINCVQGANSAMISRIAKYMRNSLKKNNLNIPVTVSFNNLPIQSGDTLSDNFVNSIVSNWDSTWNKGYPFVFIDPYPDAPGINNAKGVFNWQNGVTKYYQGKYPKIQIFIGETGAEGSSCDSTTVKVVNDIFAQLDSQYVSNKKTVPTFIFETLDEQLKGGSPNQQHMGIFKDTISPGCIIMNLKNGVKLSSFMK